MHLNIIKHLLKHFNYIKTLVVPKAATISIAIVAISAAIAEVSAVVAMVGAAITTEFTTPAFNCGVGTT